MKIRSFQSYVVIALASLLVSCSSSKTYFTPQIRQKIESSGTQLTQLQFYIDRDVELSREIVQGETKVTSGTVRFENGKSLNIILLKKNTPGVCTDVAPDKVLLSFEIGDGKILTFGRSKNGTTDDAYKILANSWISNYGMINYEGKKYFIHKGTDASIKIKTSELNRVDVNKRKMAGRKVN